MDVIRHGFCGVDEAGRGPLAGPVVAAAVILDPNKPIEGLDDSKKIAEKKRDQLEKTIKDCAIAWSVAYADVAEIDQINILQATMLAMQRAIAQLCVKPQKILIDGNVVPKNLSIQAEAVIQGDAKIPEIAAASILAKVERDRCMRMLDQDYPRYGFKTHKGYGTKSHMDALQKWGVTPIHRRSFAPVKQLCHEGI